MEINSKIVKKLIEALEDLKKSTKGTEIINDLDQEWIIKLSNE